jgi:hypothetical protein
VELAPRLPDDRRSRIGNVAIRPIAAYYGAFTANQKRAAGKRPKSICAWLSRSNFVDWKREIAIAHLVKQKVAEVDTAGLWLHPFPGVAASETDVISLEALLGVSLDSKLREFLLHANGWRSLLHSIDVFSVEDFRDGERKHRADELLESLEDTQDLCEFRPDELMPFAVSTEDIDVFVISRKESHAPGRVLWFAGGLVESYPDFDEWFLAMVDYNRRQYGKLAGLTDLN